MIWTVCEVLALEERDPGTALGAGDGLGDAFVKADVSVFAVVVSFLGHTVWLVGS